ncbi:MAG: M20/M25/M40 family metallo-hydrolase [Acidobacteria bacterium]|nr:M20/M25/M40 family metallo-hydrolase [Acidobacteriota bacterium]
MTSTNRSSSAMLPAALLALTAVCAAQPAYRSADPEIARLISEMNAGRVARGMEKLGSFGTRDVHSATDSATEGIGAARRWLVEELKGYGPRLEVRTDSYRVKKQGRVQRDLEMVNVVAVLPGTTQKERQVILGAHYDSLSLARDTGPAARPAPGVSDNASGVAAVLEAARVMSRREWKKTLVFILFAGEEQGLFGARLHADSLLKEKTAVDAVLNLDIIGDETAGNGRKMSHLVRLFSAGPDDSPSRSAASRRCASPNRTRTTPISTRPPVVAQASGAPMLGRGKSGYDAELRWSHQPEPDLAGFAVVIRPTTAPFWEHEIFAGNVPRFTLANVSIDDLVIGVKAVSTAGHESPVAAYVAPERADGKIQLAEDVR